MLSLQEFIQQIQSLIEDPNSVLVNADTDLHTINDWSSLFGLAIIAMVNDEFDVELTGAELLNSESVESLYQTVVNKIAR